MIKRITLGSIIHEATHTFTHFDKGFGFTLKELALRPGIMQKKYLSGDRSKYQKPFSMFFICATITALAFYWITREASGSTHLEETREKFIHNYFVILQSVLSPFFAFILWLLFGNKNLNYAEVLVLFVYTLAFGFLLIIPFSMLNLFISWKWISFTGMPVMGAYIIWTNLNFFNTKPGWVIVIKSIFMLLIGWFASNIIGEQIVKWML
jgi:hypothetical protein